MELDSYDKKRKNVVNRIYVLIFCVIAVSCLFLVSPLVSSGIGNPSATVGTTLQVGAVFPEVLNVSINNGSAITLTPNATTKINCYGIIRDYDNDSTLVSANAYLFDSGLTHLDPDNFNNHYSNASCDIENDTQGLFGYVEDEYHAIANCTFDVEYYAEPGSWNCTINVSDEDLLEGMGSDTQTLNSLLAIGVPDIMDYGVVNATYVSNETVSNVTNFGNVPINLSLEGYAVTPADGYSMNCSKGANKNIDIGYSMYNLSSSNAGPLSLSGSQGLHFNLTSAATTREFNLAKRTVGEVVKESYFRMYVPHGVAGTCEGNIVFSAVVGPAA